VHRIGRTGRAGRDGKAITICSPRDEKNFDDVEKLIQKEIPRLDNPVKTAKPEARTEEREEKKPRSRKSAVKEKDGGKERSAGKEKAAGRPASAGARSSSGKPQRGGRNDRDNGKQVVGMGDHLPSFIALSFAERRAG
jgi:ATP-dependent RNA helicase RhlE